MISMLTIASGSAFADEADQLDQLIRSKKFDVNPPRSPAVPANAPPIFRAASSDLSGSQHGAPTFLSGMASKAGDVVMSALNMIGVRYRWGGTTPDTGLDCSGFVRYVFKDTVGMVLPRRAEQMSRVGEKIKLSELEPGDLVFFNTMRRTFSHVGIYIGDNMFVHSPSTGSKVRVDQLDAAYWERRFTGARRVNLLYSPRQRQGLRSKSAGL